MTQHREFPKPGDKPRRALHPGDLVACRPLAGAWLWNDVKVHPRVLGVRAASMHGLVNDKSFISYRDTIALVLTTLDLPSIHNVDVFHPTLVLVHADVLRIKWTWGSGLVRVTT